MKDAFISYARKESIILAARIYQFFRLEGLDAWFDKINIPHGQDYQQRIYQGIESAHNFIFLISPTSVASPYCRLEIEHALRLGKRIIPVLHISLSDSDMVNLHPDLQKIDWIYARQKITNQDEFTQWRNQFENSWKELADIDKLRQWQPPDFGQPVDNIPKAFEKILEVVNHHYEYTVQHTRLLQKALEWEKAGRDTQYLLVGEERIMGEKWLLTSFTPPEQPPCQPPLLVCEFLAESRKNAYNMMSSVYISYEDDHIMQRVNFALMREGFTTSMTERSRIKQKPMETEEIESADNVLWIKSELSLQSALCAQELQYAAQFNKRIIVLVTDPQLNGTNPPDSVVIQLEWDQGNISPKSRARLIAELNLNQAYYEEHKVYLTKALKWKRQNYNNSILLQGYDLQRAESFLKAGAQLPHKPTALHQQFIEESKAKSGLLQTEVFISYSRNDGDFARRLNQELQIAGKTTWFDQDSIAKAAANFQEEIFRGIERSNNFLFIISPKSLQSDFCAVETSYAVSKGKRIITVMIAEPQGTPMPEALAQVQWIDFKNNDFYEAFGELLRTLDTDRDHVAGHTKWGLKATAWLEANREKSLLLGQIECSLAEAWLKEAYFLHPEQKLDFEALPEKSKNPQPTQLQIEFICQSRRALDAIILQEQQNARRLRNLLYRSNVALAVAILLIFTSLYFIYRIQILRSQAEKANEDLKKQKENALKLKELADQAARAARDARDKALAEKNRADELFKRAEFESKRAKANERLAEKNAEEARKNARDAQEALALSIEAQKKAQEERKAADEARAQTEKAIQELKRKEEQLFENHYYSAEEYVQIGNFPEAAAQLEFIRALRPDTLDAVALKLAADARDFYYLQISERFLRYIRKTERFSQQINEIKASLAMIYAAKGKFEQAVRILNIPQVGEELKTMMFNAAGKGQAAAQAALNSAYAYLLDKIVKTVPPEKRSEMLSKYSRQAVMESVLFARAYLKELSEHLSVQERAGGTFINMLKTEVTVGMYRMFSLENQEFTLPIEKIADQYLNVAEDMPAVLVTYEEASEYCQWLSRLLRTTVRLPSPGIWRAMAQKLDSLGKPMYRYSGDNDLDKVGWYAGNSNGYPHPTAKKIPNEKGLFDMSGNVAEWVASPTRRGRVLTLGGSYRDTEKDCRTESEKPELKYLRAPYIGFRFVF